MEKSADTLSLTPVRVFVRAGLAGEENGDLLKMAEKAGYDVLLTVDQGIPYQQQLRDRRIALIIIHATFNAIEVLEAHMAAVSEALRSIKLRQAPRIG